MNLNFSRNAVILNFVLLTSLFAGCASIGREFPSTQVPVIKIGETTQHQIRTLFGAPWRVGIEDGQRTWTYGNYHYSLFGQGSTEDLVVRFDQQGIVASYVFNTTKHKEGAPIAEK